MHYYQFNIGDYKSHTEHLSEMEDLAYRRLLDWYYLHEIPIPLDIAETARQIRMRSHTDCIATVLQEYFIRTVDGWTHGRADKEIAKTGEKSAKASESAKKRWGKQANAMRTHSECNATQDTGHKTQDTEHKTQDKPASAKRQQVILKPPAVDEQTWGDFIRSRKSKITQTAIDGIKREADKAGWTLEDALKECCTRGWQGFKASWVIGKGLGSMIQPVNKQEALEARNREVVARLLAKENLNAVE